MMNFSKCFGLKQDGDRTESTLQRRMWELGTPKLTLYEWLYKYKTTLVITFGLLLIIIILAATLNKNKIAKDPHADRFWRSYPELTKELFDDSNPRMKELSPQIEREAAMQMVGD